MRIDVNRNEYDCILDGLVGGIPKSQRKTAEQLYARLKFQLNGAPSKPSGYTPIRSAKLDSFVKQDKKTNWAFKPTRKQFEHTKTQPLPKVSLSADQILAGL